MRFSLAAFAALSFVAAVPASAQTIFSTFGPGDTYGAVGWGVSASQPMIASSFLFSGTTGSVLGSIRVGAAFNTESNVLVNFLAGSDIATATQLASYEITWTSALPSPSVYTLTSDGSVSLTSGMTYWVEMAIADPSSSWAWRFSPSSTGLAFYSGSWISGPFTAPAFDVSLASAAPVSSTTPEPATLTLLATGLVGIGAASRRRVRR